MQKVTILRLLADAGTLAAEYHDLTVRELSTKRVQMDEIWSFIHSKERKVQQKNWGKRHGDSWTWVAMDADSKLVINWLVGGRDGNFGRKFVADLAERLTDRVQLTSDGWQVYRDAVARATLLFYSKTGDYKFRPVLRPYYAEHVKKRYTEQADGRMKFTAAAMF